MVQSKQVPLKEQRGFGRPSLTRRWVPKIPSTLRSFLGVTGLIVVVVWVVVAIIAPLIAPYDPLTPDFARLRAPSGAHWFGTDISGRDVLSRVIYGSRVSLPIAGVVVVASVCFGGIVGAVAGFFGRVVDEVLMRITDLFFSFPPIILAMVITATLGPGLLNAALALSVVSWPNYARVARSLVLGAKQNDYVIAGRLMGASSMTSLRRDVVPNVAAPVLVLATLEFGNAILLLSGLSFLGLGAVPPTASWGGMVSDGVAQFSSWWISLFPGLAILTIVAGVNLIGDALRDSLDPHTSQAMEGGRAGDE